MDCMNCIEFQKYWTCIFEGERKKLILLIFSSREDIDSCCYAKVLYGPCMPELKRPNEYLKSQVHLI